MSVRQILAVRRLKSKLLPFVFALVCWISLNAELQAQRILIRAAGGMTEKLNIYNQLNEHLEGKRAAAKNRIQSCLLNIDRVCELTPKQLTRLEVAGKGAVISYHDRISKNLELKAKQSGFEFKRGVPPAGFAEDKQNQINAAPRRVRILDLGGGGNGELEKQVDAEKIWMDTVRKTLTDTQAKQLKAWETERELVIRKAAVGHLVAKANLKMFLSVDQTQKLEAYVDRKYGTWLVRKIKKPPKQNRNLIVLAGVLQPNRGIEVDDELKEFLSEPQLEIWKANFQKDLIALD